ncbi:MAG: hypothetical protein MJA29_09035 [Candidatus Omnitrophica bacterium]|nr:hypothetical protein [Candidatus Omnitrophota bacterium]
MKTLIVHASAGAGHRKAAEAVYEQFCRRDPQSSHTLCDILDYCSSFYRFCYRSAYSFLINRAPWLWGILFVLTSLPGLKQLLRRWISLNNIRHTRRFAEYLRREQFDCIIATHFLPPEIAAALKRDGSIRSRIYVVITDYGVHPFWVTPGIDEYIVATMQTRRILEGMVTQKPRVSVLGIPVDSRYAHEMSRSRICERFGLRADTFTVLVVTGSFGIGPLDRIAGILSSRDMQVLVVCARNERLRRRLEQAAYPGVKVFGFVDTMPELMAVADVIVTKPGGLTVTEVLARRIVPVFIAAIPGQESENVRVLAGYGIGKAAGSVAGVKALVGAYKRHAERMADVRSAIGNIRKPHSAEELYEQVRSGCSGTGC